METPLRVILVDDHPMVLVGIKLALARISNLQIVGEASNGDEALRVIQKVPADLVILDVNLPGLPADQLIAQAQQHNPALRTLILSASDDDQQLRRLAQVPIHGYLLKEEAPESLCQAVRVIQQGASWFSHSVAQRLLLMSQPRPEDNFFSEREKRILDLMNCGTSNSGIAQALNIARQTVSNLLSAIYQKMGVGTRLEAMMWLQGKPQLGKPSCRPVAEKWRLA